MFSKSVALSTVAIAAMILLVTTPIVANHQTFAYKHGKYYYHGKYYRYYHNGKYYNHRFPVGHYFCYGSYYHCYH